MQLTKVSCVPDIVRECLPVTISDTTWEMHRKLSQENWVLSREDGTLVAVVGVRLPALLSMDATAWIVLVGDNKPTYSDMRDGVPRVRELLAKLPWRILAETYSESDLRFAEWAGFTIIQGDADAALLEGTF